MSFFFYSRGTIILCVKTPAPSFPHLTRKRVSQHPQVPRVDCRVSCPPEPHHCLYWSEPQTMCLPDLLLLVHSLTKLVWMHTDTYLSSFTSFVFCSWANRDEVWKIMLNKEKTYLRDKHFMQRHPLLQPKMRAILLDWLMEVSLRLPADWQHWPLLESSVLLWSFLCLIPLTHSVSLKLWYVFCHFACMLP